jgi:Putative mono-oxygenase ydhR
MPIMLKVNYRLAAGRAASLHAAAQSILDWAMSPDDRGTSLCGGIYVFDDAAGAAEWQQALSKRLAQVGAQNLWFRSFEVNESAVRRSGGPIRAAWPEAGLGRRQYRNPHRLSAR